MFNVHNNRWESPGFKTRFWLSNTGTSCQDGGHSISKALYWNSKRFTLHGVSNATTLSHSDAIKFLIEQAHECDSSTVHTCMHVKHTHTHVMELKPLWCLCRAYEGLCSHVTSHLRGDRAKLTKAWNHRKMDFTGNNENSSTNPRIHCQRYCFLNVLFLKIFYHVFGE